MNKEVLQQLIVSFLLEHHVGEDINTHELTAYISREYPELVGCPCCNYPRCGHKHESPWSKNDGASLHELDENKTE